MSNNKFKDGIKYNPNSENKTSNKSGKRFYIKNMKKFRRALALVAAIDTAVAGGVGYAIGNSGNTGNSPINSDDDIKLDQYSGIIAASEYAKKKNIDEEQFLKQFDTTVETLDQIKELQKRINAKYIGKQEWIDILNDLHDLDENTIKEKYAKALGVNTGAIEIKKADEGKMTVVAKGFTRNKNGMKTIKINLEEVLTDKSFDNSESEMELLKSPSKIQEYINGVKKEKYSDEYLQNNCTKILNQISKEATTVYEFEGIKGQDGNTEEVTKMTTYEPELADVADEMKNKSNDDELER